MEIKGFRTEKGREVIKNRLENLFSIEPSEEQILNFIEMIEEGTELQYSRISGFSDKKINHRFLGGRRLERLTLFFAPYYIFRQMNRAIEKEGYGKLKENREYQNLESLL